MSKKIDWKKRYDEIINHKFHDVEKCKYCKDWYEQTIQITNTIKDKKIRKALLTCWETLWLNNCGDFDIICHIFGQDVLE